MLSLRLTSRAIDAVMTATPDLPVSADGCFTLPESEEAERRKPDVVVSRRKGKSVEWIIDVRAPGLAPQVHRLGDLRLECRIYLAIDQGRWHGLMVMGRAGGDVSRPPMDLACGGPASLFFNTRPWPRPQACVLAEGERR